MNTKIFTLIDANFNRLREGLRVLEDYERFIVNSAEQGKFLKEQRHKVATIFNDLSEYHKDILNARDVLNDKSAFINSASEMKRDSIKQILVASIKRCQESSRVLEEYLKLINPDCASSIKEIRFSLYEYEKQTINS